jgi:hypothetical protein
MQDCYIVSAYWVSKLTGNQKSVGTAAFATEELAKRQKFQLEGMGMNVTIRQGRKHVTEIDFGFPSTEKGDK